LFLLAQRGCEHAISVLWNFCEKIAGIPPLCALHYPTMTQKRKRLVVTVTERWTFVIDDEGAAPATTPSTNAHAPVPSSSRLDADPKALPAEGVLTPQVISISQE
jgi:hypothetical protein